ncbi:MAG: hypothetical protein LC104_14070 [Bacteroidales bacterium]|nr:hypothetical protein [Bacteroidales bacterium]
MTHVLALSGLTVRRPDLVLGVDGGGTHTVAVLAQRTSGRVLGRGAAGASNIQSAGEQSALRALEESIEQAFDQAGQPREPVAAACLGLAGVDRNEGLDVIQNWAARYELAGLVPVANDATLLLAAGTPEGWGVAVVAGTGSIAFTRTPTGQVDRCGGWGYLLGDEGSGYQIALAGLRAVCRAYDQCSPPTQLLTRILRHMGLPDGDGPSLIPAVYRGKWDRTVLASLAPIVLEAAQDGDAIACAIVTEQAVALAKTTAVAAQKCGFPPGAVPLALTGGVILGSALFRRLYLHALVEAGFHAEPIQCVSEPCVGAVKVACQAASSRGVSWKSSGDPAQ